MYNRTSADECPAFFKTSLRQLDHVLHGGLPSGTITEVHPACCQWSDKLSLGSSYPYAAFHKHSLGPFCVGMLGSTVMCG